MGKLYGQLILWYYDKYGTMINIPKTICHFRIRSNAIKSSEHLARDKTAETF